MHRIWSSIGVAAAAHAWACVAATPSSHTAAAGGAAGDHRMIDIPKAYQGMWVLKGANCDWRPGPAFVFIAPRKIDFYEKHEYLDLANLNEVSDPPEFYGAFSSVELLHFSREIIKLQLVGNELAITEMDEAAQNEDEVSDARWLKCKNPPNWNGE